MTPKAFLTLAILTGVAVVGAGVAVVAEQRASVVAKPGDEPMFPAVANDPGAVASLTIKGASYSLALAKQGNVWVASDMGNYPVKTGPVAQLVSGIAALKPFEAKTDDPALYPDIDVVEPAEGNRATAVTAKNAAGQTVADLIVGKLSRSIGFNPLGGTFIRRPSEAQAWLAEGQIVLPNSMADWFDSIVHIPGPDITRVAVLEGDTLVFDAEKIDLTTGDYELRTLDAKYQREDGLVAADNAIKAVSTGVVSTTFESARPEADLVRGPDSRTIRFAVKDGMQLEVRLGEVNGETWVAYSATAPAGSDGEARAKTISDRTAGFAFKLPSYRITPLQRPVADLVEKPDADNQFPGAGPGAPQVPGVLMPGQTLIPRLPGLGGQGNFPTITTPPR